MNAPLPSPAREWKALSRSARGASHERAGTPNQDACATEILERAGVILAVADGHGAPMHARSQDGAQFAVAQAIAVLSAFVSSTAGLAEEAVLRAAAALPARLVEGWRERVLSDLVRRPVDPGEARASPKRIARDPGVLYGSTLLAAAITARLAVYIQIGDGDILTIAKGDPPRRPVRGRDDLPVSQTDSLCQSDAAERVRHQVDFFPPGERPDLVMLATDGCANSFAEDADFLQVASDLQNYLEHQGPGWVEANLQALLKDLAEKGSGDDVTLALAWLARPQVPPKRRRFALAAAAALLAAAVPLGWISWSLLRSPAGEKQESLVSTIAAPGVVRSIAVSPDGILLAAATDAGAQLWNLHTNAPVRPPQIPAGRLRAVAFSSDGKSIAWAADRAVSVSETETGRVVQTLSEPGGIVRALAFAPDGMSIAFARDDVVGLWNFDQVRFLKGHPGAVNSVAFAPDGSRIVSGGAEGDVRIWNLADGQSTVISAHAGAVHAVAFSPASPLLGSGGEDGAVKLWSAADGRLVRALELQPAPVRAIAFASDGAIAAAAGKGVAVLDAQGGGRLQTFAGNTGAVDAIVFSPDGRFLIAGGDDKTIRIWSALRQPRPSDGGPRP